MEKQNHKVTNALKWLKSLKGTADGWHSIIYVPFLLSHGLTMKDVTSVNSFFMLAFFFLDPITGSIADWLGQRKVYLAGTFFWGAGMFVYGMSETYLMFIFAEMLAAIGGALMSEALESWVHNMVDKKTSHTSRSVADFLGRIGSVPSAIIGAWIASNYGLHYPWFFSGVTMTIALLVGISILRDLPDTVNEDDKTTDTEYNNVFIILKEGFSQTIKDPNLRLAALIMFVGSVTFQPFNMFWVPIFQENGLALDTAGVSWGFIATSLALGSYGAKYFQKVERKHLTGILLLIGVPMIFPHLASEIGVIFACFVVHELGRGAFKPTLFSFCNDFIPEKTRSTANSFLSSVRLAGSFVGLRIAGTLSLSFSLLRIWMFAGVALILFAAITALYKIEQTDDE